MKKIVTVHKAGTPPWMEVKITTTKKIKPGKFTPWMEVSLAMARGDYLSKTERKEAMWHFRGGFRMSLKKACLIAFKYAFGWIPEDREGLPRITLAWLRIGKNMWERIMGFVRALNITHALSVPRIHQWLNDFFARFTPALL